MEMDIFLQNAGTSKDLRIALKVCVMLTLNTVVFKLILLYLKKDIVTIPQTPHTFSDVDLPAEMFQGISCTPYFQLIDL